MLRNPIQFTKSAFHHDRCLSMDTDEHSSGSVEALYVDMAVTTLIFSLAPRWIDGVLVGSKTVELRRRPPQITSAVPAYLYETRPHCRIRIKCFVGPVLSLSPDALWKEVGSKSLVDRNYFDKYFEGAELAHAIAIRDVVDLGTAITLERLRAVGFTPPQSWCRAQTKIVNFVEAL
jgi:predicted transcriptional regulator